MALDPRTNDMDYNNMKKKKNRFFYRLSNIHTESIDHVYY